MNDRLSGYMLYLTALKIELMEKPALILTASGNFRSACSFQIPHWDQSSNLQMSIMSLSDGKCIVQF